jgi:alpha-amylase
MLATYFVWDAPAINRAETNGGQKLAIVELFGWPYADIEKECVFLGKAGYGGVRIWPPSGKKIILCSV